MKQLARRVLDLVKLYPDKLFKKKYDLGSKYFEDTFHISTAKKSLQEIKLSPKRFDIINACLDSLNRETTYLEIGVRFPEHNFDKINATLKYSVDPGVENVENPVDFKVTSDHFFHGLRNGEFLENDIRFDVVFIDGLHLAEQVERDIENALQFIKDDGFIILHDCNPPTEFHARENYSYMLSPASGYWNGTTWKAFFKYRCREDINSCCVNTDWGIGVLHKNIKLAIRPIISNPFYEYEKLVANRSENLGLISFEEFIKVIN
ncbi:hypothetical protein ULMA_18120 [Patiriisocius marinus]|uniref:Class I SAM-dependent methyltransferase n=1 Tax=Patiriisocius marinus TaxID=1397112 RepID=A0A5J4IXK9_9FLAO|nr:class I SAM-dependent methyltransferase [Patiriisocius marinus]GER59704.1 hypothetical protein ULMA_18120 [Patiriisocius marinus]